MSLKVVGAGLGRTGTNSLKLALERLLGGPCHHMLELFHHRDQVPIWHAAVRDEPVDWHALMQGYRAAVDWPSSAFWPELAEAFPDAIVLLSVRDAESWWKSADRTIFERFRTGPGAAPDPWFEMVSDLLRARFTPGFLDPATAMRAFEHHLEDVRRRVPRERLVEWRAEDGWEPLCRALGLPVPVEPFPHVNTTEQFRARAGLE